MDNMQIYEKFRNPPREALRPISAGRLKGKTDINPMWRIKALTELFGPCGIGWYYTVDRQWIEPHGDEAAAFTNISLYVKADGEWSKPIFGTGGSMLAAKEKNGIYVSDEAMKMATTDAISVACKQLGIAADVYWNSDNTKYSTQQPAQMPEARQPAYSGQVERQGPAYPTMEEMINAIAKKYPEGSKNRQQLLAYLRVERLVDASEAQLRAVYQKCA
jgi:hypothetical protein